MFFSCLDEEQALSVLSSALQDWQPSCDARNFGVSWCTGKQKGNSAIFTLSGHSHDDSPVVLNLDMPRPFNTAVSVVVMTANHIFFSLLLC